ncbi:hypothetical protein [Sphingomonas sp. SUN039]|uniref:hypothetical protein n=1 Tax=Sphingomonas sp. SUN039 TaxID=2937787 RepID=UPI002164C7C3|nr:hypothetical protein [Sphingomonas sp. SUN039]UVO55487.1 hypothetical protein M0209_15670 [Sphingomonas sp. SUN039]
MKNRILAATAILTLATLGACSNMNNTQEAASNNMEATADNMDAMADNMTGNAAEKMENKADAMEEAADNAADGNLATANAQAMNAMK